MQWDQCGRKESVRCPVLSGVGGMGRVERMPKFRRETGFLRNGMGTAESKLRARRRNCDGMRGRAERKAALQYARVHELDELERLVGMFRVLRDRESEAIAVMPTGE